MKAIRARNPLIAIEVLTPDFWGGHPDPQQAVAAQRERLATVLAAEPVCFNHNLETVQRLQGEVRRGATYERSLGLLAIRDDERQHSRLVRYFRQRGFQLERDVAAALWDLPLRMVWGGAGALMSGSVEQVLERSLRSWRQSAA